MLYIEFYRLYSGFWARDLIPFFTMILQWFLRLSLKCVMFFAVIFYCR